MNWSRSNRRQHPMLADAPHLPRGTEALWSDFLRLHASRGSNGMAPARIGFMQIDAFERVNQVKLDAWEIDAIFGADDAYFASRAS